MPRCPYCRKTLYESREKLGARCPYCREPLYEPPADEERPARAAAGNLCAVHSENPAQGTCQRCGNYMCAVCRTRWRDRAWCAACVERALEAGEASPEEARTHLRQGVLGLIFGIAAWVIVLVAVVMMAAGISGGQDQANVILIGFGFIILMASPLCAVLGVGQSAAAIRMRGDHMIMATAGLIMSGLNAAVVIGILALTVWQD